MKDSGFKIIIRKEKLNNVDYSCYLTELLTVALKYRQYEFAQFLVNNGVDIKGINSHDDRSFLTEAAYYKEIDYLEFLMKNKIDVSQRDLVHAALSQDLDILYTVHQYAVSKYFKEDLFKITKGVLKDYVLNNGIESCSFRNIKLIIVKYLVEISTVDDLNSFINDDELRRKISYDVLPVILDEVKKELLERA